LCGSPALRPAPRRCPAPQRAAARAAGAPRGRAAPGASTDESREGGGRDEGSQYCICESIHSIRRESLDALNARAPLHFVVWMHHKERRRASNTGKLLKLLMPDHTDILIDGVPEDDQKLQELILGRRAFVLYPSEDAVPIPVALGASSVPVASPWPVATHGGASPPVAVLIDGTWNQAQRMHKHFEHMQHVVVFPEGQSQFHWRRQSQEGRISTIEAAALVLEELGELNTEHLLRALELLMDALGRQCHHDTLFQHALPKPTGKKKFALGAKKIQKLLPGQRGSQGDVIEEK
ncbi:tRNA-uridine aminocarboxypropyltransferase (SAM-dependent 3-amino-3-carboxypropyl transferase) (tRNA U47 acp transferase A) (tRNA aminocarboxypropyltransferase), partial [Durusdinium trenchii]